MIREDKKYLKELGKQETGLNGSLKLLKEEKMAKECEKELK